MISNTSTICVLSEKRRFETYLVFIRWMIILLVGMTISACANWGDNIFSLEATSTVYLPPTASQLSKPSLPTGSPESQQAISEGELLHPTATPTCFDNLTFIADESIPDGTQVSAGEMLDKAWEVQNSGTCNWDSRYRVKLIAGPNLGAAPEQALFPARSGAHAILRIRFIAPSEAGGYRSAWQAFDPAGQPFGDPFFIEIEVKPGQTEP